MSVRTCSSNANPRPGTSLSTWRTTEPGRLSVYPCRPSVASPSRLVHGGTRRISISTGTSLRSRDDESGPEEWTASHSAAQSSKCSDIFKIALTLVPGFDNDLSTLSSEPPAI